MWLICFKPVWWKPLGPEKTTKRLERWLYVYILHLYRMGDVCRNWRFYEIRLVFLAHLHPTAYKMAPFEYLSIFQNALHSHGITHSKYSYFGSEDFGSSANLRWTGILMLFPLTITFYYRGSVSAILLSVDFLPVRQRVFKIEEAGAFEGSFKAIIIICTNSMFSNEIALVFRRIIVPLRRHTVLWLIIDVVLYEWKLRTIQN